MSITLTGTGGLFTRTGVWARLIRTLNGARGSTAPNPGSSWGGTTKTIFDLQTAVANINAQYASTLQGIAAGLYGVSANDGVIGTIRQSVGSQLNTLATAVRNTIIQMADADSPLPVEDLPTALGVLISQMKGTADSIKKPTVTITPTAGGSNVGDWKMIGSVIAPDGLQNDYCLAETMTATITNDAQHSAALLGSEPLSIRAPNPTSADSLDWTYPSYSGASQNINLTDPAIDNGQNMLTNSDLETYTVANNPDKWIKLVGVLGTDILSDSSNEYLGSKCLSYVGDAATLSEIAQTFGDSSNGTPASLEPNTVYGVGIRTKVDVVPAAGVLKIALKNQSDTIFNDDAGTANSFTISLPGETTSYAFHGGFFRTPKSLPTTQKISIGLSTALSSGSVVFMDALAMCKATRMYPGGPYVAAFRGATAALIDDTYSLAVANDWATAAIFALVLQQICDLRGLGLRIPSNSSNTINENLIT